MEASALQAPQARLRLSLPGTLLRLRSDEQLVALFRAGSGDAFGVIHDRYQARLLAYVRQMLGASRGDAEDALQDVFIRAYNALRADERPITLKAWLYRVAHNRCIDLLRRPVPEHADVFELNRAPECDPERETEQRESLRRLVADVRRLPDQQRSALLMREMEGLSYEDLAESLDVTVPAVKSLLVRARMGLVQAAEARDVACQEVRVDLATAHGRGVRANARARRHLRDCAGCRDYRTDLRRTQRQVAALGGPVSVGLLAKLFGGGSAAAGGGAAATSAMVSGGAVVGSGVLGAAATKIAIVAGAAVVAAGGAVEVEQQIEKRYAADVAPARAKPAPEVVRQVSLADPTPAVAALRAPATGGSATAAGAGKPRAAKRSGRASAPPVVSEPPDVAAPPVLKPESSVIAEEPAPVAPTTSSTSSAQTAAPPVDPLAKPVTAVTSAVSPAPGSSNGTSTQTPQNGASSGTSASGSGSGASGSSSASSSSPQASGASEGASAPPPAR